MFIDNQVHLLYFLLFVGKTKLNKNWISYDVMLFTNAIVKEMLGKWSQINFVRLKLH